MEMEMKRGMGEEVDNERQGKARQGKARGSQGQDEDEECARGAMD